MPASSRPVAATNPYPWPYDGALVPMRTALVVAGAQATWLAASPNGDVVRDCIASLIAPLQAHGVLVVGLAHVRPSHRSATAGPGRSAVPQIGSVGAEPVGFGGVSVDLTVVTQGIDGFYASPLEAELRAAGRTHLLMVGFASEITMDSTLRGANDRGFECLVLTDACAPIDPVMGAHALASVTMSGGIFGALGTSAAVLATLQAPSNTPASTPASISASEEHS